MSPCIDPLAIDPLESEILEVMWCMPSDSERSSRGVAQKVAIHNCYVGNDEAGRERRLGADCSRSAVSLQTPLYPRAIEKRKGPSIYLFVPERANGGS